MIQTETPQSFRNTKKVKEDLDITIIYNPGSSETTTASVLHCECNCPHTIVCKLSAPTIITVKAGMATVDFSWRGRDESIAQMATIFNRL